LKRLRNDEHQLTYTTNKGTIGRVCLSVCCAMLNSQDSGDVSAEAQQGRLTM